MEKKNVDKKELQQRLRVGQPPASNDMANKKTALTLNEAKKKGRERSSQNSSAKSSDDDTIVKDIYQNVSGNLLEILEFFFLIRVILFLNVSLHRH